MYVDENLVVKARKADLYVFLLAHHPGSFRPEGRSLRMVGNRGISIKQGYYGYKNFSSGDSGNGIDFLMKYLGYTFQAAVLALAGSCTGFSMSQSADGSMGGISRPVNLPAPAPLPHSRMYAFLIKRGIPQPVVEAFARKGLIYQSKGRNNIVFVNKERDYCELRGTFTFGEKPFHGCLKAKPDRFWYFTEGSQKPTEAYITEAAIDAISLWLLHKSSGRDTSTSVYISIGGASNHQAISRVKTRIRTIIAVDNDNAGEECRKHHSELEYILPVNKDWNEDLQKQK